MRRGASASAPEQQPYKTALLQVPSFREVAAKQSGRKTPQPTPLGNKKEAFLRSVPIEKSFNVSCDRMAVMAKLPPLKDTEEDGSSGPTSIGNLSTQDQLPTEANCLTDDTLPTLECIP